MPVSLSGDLLHFDPSTAQWKLDVTGSRQPGLLDMVAVPDGSGEPGIQAGDVGAIVELFPSGGLEVEFPSRDGRTRHVGTLSIGDVLVPDRERTRVARDACTSRGRAR